jgi:hypothetical protein
MGSKGMGERHYPKGRLTVKWALYKLTLPLEELFFLKTAYRWIGKTVYCGRENGPTLALAWLDFLSVAASFKGQNRRL